MNLNLITLLLNIGEDKVRLTKQMKEDLYTIVVNQTTNPRTAKEDEFKKRFQDLVFEELPIFKQFVDEYGMSYSFRESLNAK